MLAIPFLLDCTTVHALSPLPVTAPDVPVARATSDATPVSFDVVEGSHATVTRVTREHRTEYMHNLYESNSATRTTETICVAPCTAMMPRGSYLIEIDQAGDDVAHIPYTTAFRVGRAPTALRARLGEKSDASSFGMTAAWAFYITGIAAVSIGSSILAVGVADSPTEEKRQQAAIGGSITTAIGLACWAIGLAINLASRPTRREGSSMHR